MTSAFFDSAWEWHADDNYEWNWSKLIGADHGELTGLFVDDLARTGWHVESVGASVDCASYCTKLPSYPPTLKIPDSKWISNNGRAVDHPSGTFFSSVSVKSVKTLQVLRNGPRCLGLRVEHLNETQRFAGQWDPSRTFSITTIFDCKASPFQGLAISIAGEGAETYVADIQAGGDDKDPDTRYFSSQQLSKV